MKYVFLLFVTTIITGCSSHAPSEKPTDAQTRHLASYCKVWGFLKYHHPAVTNRNLDWDETFVQFYPKVRKAATNDEFNDVLEALFERLATADTSEARTMWATELGTPNSVQIADFTWIEDGTTFSDEISEKLTEVKTAFTPQYNEYISPSEYVANPDLSSDTAYYTTTYPSEPVRALAVARYWNLVNYFFVYKDEIDMPWDTVLTTYLPRVVEAPDTLSYLLAMAEFCRKINDAHAFIENEYLAEYLGSGDMNIELAYIDGKTVVRGGTRLMTNPDSTLATLGIRKGDIITAINGKPTEALRKALLPIVPGSNEASYHREVNRRLLRGKPHAKLTLKLSDGTAEREVTTTYPPRDSSYSFDKYTAGKSWKILDHNVGYIDLSKLRPEVVNETMGALMNTTAIIFDVRRGANNTLYALTEYLSAERPFVYFTIPDYGHPGYLSIEDTLSAGKDPRYKGNVVILVDEYTQSHLEFTVMALQVTPGAKTFGSQTAGADGNVSHILLPGKLKVYFSGIGVFYPDGTPTQRVGIKIDEVVKPTIEGLRQGRDEVLEYAVNYLKGNISQLR